MTTKYAKLVAWMAQRPTRVNLERAEAMAKAESNKAGSGDAYYAWNRVLHALWNVREIVGDDAP